MKTLLLIGGGIVVVGAASLFGPGAFRSKVADARFEDSVFVARRGDLDVTITENGYLKSTNSVSLKPKFRGQSVITMLIDEGTEVKEGDLLVEFDATELQNRLEETQNSLIQYEAELEAAEASLEIQHRENEAAIEKAELALEVARLTLERYEKGEYPNTARKNQLTVEKARSEHQRAQESFEQVPELAAEGFLTSIQVEEERIRLKEAEINLENAEKDLELYETYTRPMEHKQKQSEVTDAERTLLNAREKAEINLKEKEARVSQQERLVASTKSSIEKIEKDLESMKILAPQPGIVLHGDPKNPWMKDNIQIGNPVWQGWTLITLPDLTEMQVLLSVHEADIAQVKPDQRCVITLDTYKGKVFTGKVTDIASVANSDGWRDSSNKQFRVEVTITDLDIEVRAGITAKVEIQIEHLEDVLHVPVHAVFKEGEEFFCFVPTEEGFGRKTVEIGKNNEHYVCVESGLEEGDRVLLFDPREGDAVEDTVVESAGEEEALPLALGGAAGGE